MINKSLGGRNQASFVEEQSILSCNVQEGNRCRFREAAKADPFLVAHKPQKSSTKHCRAVPSLSLVGKEIHSSWRWFSVEGSCQKCGHSKLRERGKALWNSRQVFNQKLLLSERRCESICSNSSVLFPFEKGRLWAKNVTRRKRTNQKKLSIKIQ